MLRIFYNIITGIFKDDPSMEEYQRLSDIRNQLDIIHGKPDCELIDPDPYDVSTQDLYDLLNIFYQIFIGKKCDYLPAKDITEHYE